MENAKIMKNKLQNSGYKVYGGDNAPYIWIKVPDQKVLVICVEEHSQPTFSILLY